MEQIHAFERENTIFFSSRKALIQFVSKYFANRYKEHCEFWKATAMDDPKEMAWWDARIEREVPRLQKALNCYLRKKMRFGGDYLMFTSESVFFQKVFKKAKMSCKPTNCITCNVEYVIDGVAFKQFVKSSSI